MRAILLVILFQTSSVVFCQDYASFVGQADKFYENKDYESSVEQYKSAFKLAHKAADLYNAGCSAALSGNKKLAFKWLNLALSEGWTNIKHLKQDADLESLHDSKRWQQLLEAMQAEVDRKEANYNKPLQSQLLSIYDDDQLIRKEYIAAQKELGSNSTLVDSLAEVMLFNDSINLIKVMAILDEYGWVGADLVGSQANQTLFLVIQHADLQTQQKYLPMMREAVKSKNANPGSLALLEDRVALREGRRQIYGSQIGTDKETQQNYVLPLEDPDNVDKRRAEVGLGKLEDYLKNWDIIWDVEAYKAQLPALELKLKKEK
ncbi:MAG: hypothetical protein K1X55_15800 [Chitinophagales bacterium]|nr:hypothetical protein [Chitinophagales bacterium]